ncbi:flagellar hook-basal body complex protein FliE [Sinorhizobium numidicum]|uniref:Flagellar hook-basal body complex protein FliE n=1 Tax=Sinorhizobium numidicum TaxID=680248 RepID=A0ABY8D1D8_9HYPH|nr:flagellar hook-basal body complex protein FliE [Sinorhizobium numidicum]WEX78025.1 flagellar hook-basal body complex protein FliE [Sinorhizobium numidicum]WEX84684.1 flagellar hook-basal body complex protein FliE [Sinorhizobium numidicum]
MIDAIQSVGAFSAMKEVEGTNLTASTSLAMPVAGASVPQSQSFAEVLGNMTTDAIRSMKSAEGASLQAVRGEANTREVIDAVMNAEQSLQTAIAIRDKVVSAYLEIARMQI